MLAGALCLELSDLTVPVHSSPTDLTPIWVIGDEQYESRDSPVGSPLLEAFLLPVLLVSLHFLVTRLCHSLWCLGIRLSWFITNYETRKNRNQAIPWNLPETRGQSHFLYFPGLIGQLVAAHYWLALYYNQTRLSTEIYPYLYLYSFYFKEPSWSNMWTTSPQSGNTGKAE